MRACLSALLVLLALPEAKAALPQYEDQVVALLVTYQAFDEYRPWTKLDPSSLTAAALVVDDSLLLTEAEIVRDATLIQVQKHASARRVPARVIHIDHDIDLAVLAVEEPGFFDDLEAARFADSAPSEGHVHSVRWRDQQLEVSSSRVARVEVKKSPYGSIQHAFLLVTTDLSGGGWAEPVFSKGRFVGLTVSQKGQSASVIPVEIISAFLRDVRSGDYRGFASIDVMWQFTQDRALAAYLGLRGEPRGVVLREISWASTGYGVFEPRDVLLSLDGHAIDGVGKYQHRRYGQVLFHHLALDGHRPGDVVPAQVLRARKVVDLEIELRRYPGACRLVPWRRDDSPPPYLVAGGLVLRELDGKYLSAWGNDWRATAPATLVRRYDLQSRFQTPERRRILVLSHVLPDAYNLGYHDLANLALADINGRAVDSIADAEEAFHHPVDGLHRLDFYPDDSRSQVVLEAAGFEEATARILEAYNVPERIRRRTTAVECSASKAGVFDGGRE
jgi:S1-C subfamily serine protease